MYYIRYFDVKKRSKLAYNRPYIVHTIAFRIIYYVNPPSSCVFLNGVVFAYFRIL